MELSDSLLMVNALLQLKLRRKNMPFVVSWALTDRCNSKCKYCVRWKKNTSELDTRQILSIINELSSAGTRRIIFTGGEPLLRQDIGQIVDYASVRGIHTAINSNGYLVPQKINQLAGLKRFVFSLDGPRQVHDSVRGQGSYDRTIEAIKVARGRGIGVELVTVLFKRNLDCVDYIIEIAKGQDIKVIFQPIVEHLLDKENADFLLPEQDSYRKAIASLISKKQKGNIYIRNSLAGLRHLYDWPHPRMIECTGGLLSCRIDTNGDVNYCDKVNPDKKIFNCVIHGFKKAFANLTPYRCFSCWCALRVELNYLFKLNFNCIHNLIKIETGH